MGFDIRRATKFEINIGKDEQKKRYAIGSTALLISVFAASVPLLILGCILVGTAKMTWCPVWSALGRNSCDGSAIKTG